MFAEYRYLPIFELSYQQLVGEPLVVQCISPVSAGERLGDALLSSSLLLLLELYT